MPYLQMLSHGADAAAASNGKNIYGPRTFDRKLTQSLFNSMRDIARSGVTFAGKVALVTGCGKGSIGAEIVRALLEGGARVVATTSRFSERSTRHFRDMYEKHAGRGARLVVVPFNGGSSQDVSSLVSFIYAGFGENDDDDEYDDGNSKDTAARGKSDKKKKKKKKRSLDKGLGLDLDFVIPFAAISENGSDISGIGARSELAHRIMLTNVVRLLGAVREEKRRRGIETRPAHVLLPLSPNHGVFGNDGLYAESKIALESLCNKWKSEAWGDYLTLAGAVIGWTRGTGLMSANNSVAPGVEALGCRTFSTAEMAFNLVSLLHPRMCVLSQSAPLWADFGGGELFS